MDDKPIQKMKPWYRGFQGKIDFKKINEVGAHQYTNHGIIK